MNSNEDQQAVNHFNKDLDPTYNRANSTVDPFDVEELVRMTFDLGENDPTPDGINITYNDLVDYTTYIIKLAFESQDKVFKEMLKQNGNNNKID